MKHIFFILLLAFPCLLNAQDTGAVYNFTFRIDDKLTDEISTTRGSGFFSGWSVGDEFPEPLIDSIKVRTAFILSKLLAMPTDMLYKRDAKGKIVEPVLTAGGLEGLPCLSPKAARELCTGCKRFVYLFVHVYASGEIGIGLPDGTHSKIKPRLDLHLKVYDENKEVVLQKNVSNKNFAKLRAMEWYDTDLRTNVKVTKAINPYDVYAMYLMSLNQLIEVKMGE